LSSEPVGYGIEGNEKEDQMKRVIAGGTAGVLMLAATGSLLAHHSLARFDTTTAVRVKGVIVLVAWVNPHSVLYVDEKRPDGRTQRWAAEGPGLLQLDRRAIGKDAFKVGDVIEVCGYTLKDEFDLPRTTSIEPSSSSPKDTTSASLSGRVLAAEDLVMPDGKKRSWGDYGHHKCHAPDDVDIHPNYFPRQSE
jgi:hypothetical protein